MHNVKLMHANIEAVTGIIQLLSTFTGLHVVIALETGRQWLHHLGFSIYNHQKGVFFDGHEQDDVIAYWAELLEKLAKFSGMKQPSHHHNHVIIHPCTEFKGMIFCKSQQ